jgi:hypothetical protein
MKTDFKLYIEAEINMEVGATKGRPHFLLRGRFYRGIDPGRLCISIIGFTPWIAITTMSSGVI